MQQGCQGGFHFDDRFTHGASQSQPKFARRQSDPGQKGEMPTGQCLSQARKKVFQQSLPNWFNRRNEMRVRRTNRNSIQPI
jgi:hypothetical protein